MKTLIFSSILLLSSVGIAGEMITLDGPKICPYINFFANTDSGTHADVANCVKVMDQKLFDIDAATICANLPVATGGREVTPGDAIECFATIADKTYDEKSIDICKNISVTSGVNQSAAVIIECLNR